MHRILQYCCVLWETTANIDVFELTVAKSTTFYHIFQWFYALRRRKHCKYRCFWACRGPKHCYLQCSWACCQKTLQFATVSTTWPPKPLLFARFFTFSCKDVKPRQFTKTLQKPMFLPSKNGENCRPNSSEIAKSGAPAARQETWKKERLEVENRRPNVKKLNVF